MKPLSDTLFIEKQIFHQDSGPAHKIKIIQHKLEKNLLEFIASQDWPLESSDFNPLDYRLWSILEENACSKPHQNIELLKVDLVKAAASIPLELVRALINE